MKRRGNKSNKVPNVKLRPADKGAYSHPVVESCWAQDTQAPEESSAFHDTCPRPLKDVVICATGIADKPTLFKQAVELGATCTLAFTDRVTHLIAVDHGGAKYMCALERKIPIMKPSWITDNFQIWLKGDDVDSEQSVLAHRLPIFSGVIVCPSGITDITRRTQISKLITTHDGAYLKNLERPVRVTHLLCSGDEETDKMRYAEKFNARGEAKIHLVWEEWFWDSLDFGGRFDEGMYEVRRPRPERKQLMVQQPAGPPPSSSLPSRFDEAPTSSAPRNAPPQNQNSANGVTDNDMEDEPAFARVLPNVTLQLWGNLLGRRGYQVTDGEIILSPSKSDAGNAKHRKPHPPSSPTPEHEHGRPAFGAARSVISSFRRANSFAPQETSTAKQGLPFRRTVTSSAVFANAGAVAGPSRLPAEVRAPGPAMIQQRASSSNAGQPEANASNSKTLESESSTEPQIFTGVRIRLMGEAKGAPVRTAIEQRGGVVMAGDEGDNGHDDVDYVVVRLVSGSKLFLLEDDPRIKAKFRTECWLEQCIFEDRVCLPSEHLAFVPLGIPTPVPRAEQVVFSFSGFEESVGHALKRLLRAFGITLAPTFNKRATHLLCPSGVGLKFDKAAEWGVPVVNMGWLEEMARTGNVPPVGSFLVTGPPGVVFVESPLGLPPVVFPLANHEDAAAKGKGKAVERPDKGKGRALPGVADEAVTSGQLVTGAHGKRIVDITNDLDVPSNIDEPAPKKQKQKSAASLVREPTTIIPNVPQQGGSRSLARDRTGSTFSNSGYFGHPSSIPTQSRLPSMPPIGSEEGDEDSPPPVVTPDHQLFVPNRSSALHSLRHQPGLPYSNPQVEAEKSNPNFRIPSSKSPSPMKLRIPDACPPPAARAEAGAAPVQQRQLRRTNSRGMSLSPVKIDHEAARALQESITSLLGKRPSTDAEDMAGGAGNANANGRGAKRARPQRNKAQSRQVSNASIDLAAPAAGTNDRAVGSGNHGAADYPSESAIGAFESYEEHGHGPPGGARSSGQAEENSMRVLYEDPGQRLEKQRLMDLLKSQNGEEDSISSGTSSFARKAARRSARIGG